MKNVDDLPKYSFQDMLAEARNIGLAFQDRFALRLQFSNDLARKIGGSDSNNAPMAVYLLCQSYNMPQTSLALKQMRWDEGPMFSRPQSIDFSGDAVAIDFILDEDMEIKRFFEAWIKFTFDQDTASVAFPSLYTQKIAMYNLDSMDNPRHIVELEGAFPRSISAVTFNQSAHNTPATVTVTFTFHRMRTYQGPGHDMLFDEEKYPEMRGVRQIDLVNRDKSLLDRGLEHFGFDRGPKFEDFPGREFWDPTDPRINRENRTIIGKTLGFFASQNPTIYNIINKTPIISL